MKKIPLPQPHPQKLLGNYNRLLYGIRVVIASLWAIGFRLKESFDVFESTLL